MPSLPILYTFRRCPYAMRARMAIEYAGVKVEYREITLKKKPACMLAASPKGTVPVLVLNDGRVLDESLAIMQWCLSQYDPDDWQAQAQQQAIDHLININDTHFKYWLDRYKYAVRYPEHSESYYCTQAQAFIAHLEKILQQQPWLVGKRLTRLDISIFPFIRQFAMVDANKFAQAPYPNIKQWLEHLLNSPIFLNCMHKRPVWEKPLAEKALSMTKASSEKNQHKHATT